MQHIGGGEAGGQGVEHVLGEAVFLKEHDGDAARRERAAQAAAEAGGTLPRAPAEGEDAVPPAGDVHLLAFGRAEVDDPGVQPAGGQEVDALVEPGVHAAEAGGVVPDEGYGGHGKWRDEEKGRQGEGEKYFGVRRQHRTPCVSPLLGALFGRGRSANRQQKR